MIIPVLIKMDKSVLKGVSRCDKIRRLFHEEDQLRLTDGFMPGKTLSFNRFAVCYS